MTKPGKIKSPKAHGGQHLKAPQQSGQQSATQEYPIFCLRWLKGLDGFEQKDKAALAARLAKLAVMRWNEIQSAPREGFGHEKIPVQQVTATLPEFARAEGYVLVFRLGDSCRMLAQREGVLLRILHLDPTHKAY